MFRLFARWWAKRKYIWQEELTAGINDLQASLAAQRAQEARALAAQLTTEADVIEENIRKVDTEEAARKETENYKALAAQEKYDDERQVHKERSDAQNIAASKRSSATQYEEKAKGGEDTAKHFRGQATSNREVADRLRKF